jgi:AbrB family looped-hinge helix DNA binding protein
MIPTTTIMSSRGQIVIAAQIRQRLNLEPGTAFIVLGKGDTVVLHRLAEPPWKEFDALTSEAGRQGHHTDLAMQALKKVFTKLRYTR